MCILSVLYHVDFYIEMTYRHHMTLDGHCIALDIMDTAGKVSKQTNNQLKTKYKRPGGTSIGIVSIFMRWNPGPLDHRGERWPDSY